MRHVWIALGVLATGCAAEPAPRPVPKMDADERELIELHESIWDLMELGPDARRELNSIVLRLRRNIKYNEMRRPELAQLIIPGSQPRQSTTRERFFEAHRNRFRLLDLSASTQEELLAAMDWVWTALHDPNASADRKRRAEEIRELMAPGLPPCQDDRLFDRARTPE